MNNLKGEIQENSGMNPHINHSRNFRDDEKGKETNGFANLT